eukprot:Sspe_Gene.2160::Locus_713_Transcript_2_3_Confidence_0.600_Length_2897::g.2160::m.2160
MKSKHQAMLDYQKKLNDLEVKKADRLSQIEAKKFEETMSAIGPETVLSIAQAGPELQAKLLEGLGLKGYLITDGNSPINLFNTARGNDRGDGEVIQPQHPELPRPPHPVFPTLHPSSCNLTSLACRARVRGG